MTHRFSRLPWHVLLPFLLALFPLLIFWRGAEWEKKQNLRELEESWLRKADRGSRWLNKAGEASYWAELTARRFGSMTRRRLESLSAAHRPPGNAEIREAVLSAARRMHPSGMPSCKLFVLPIAPEVPGTRPALLTGPGLSDRPLRLMTSLLDAIAEEWRGRPSPLSQREWQNRFEHTFGFGVSGELFVPGYKGTSIPVVFERAYGNLVWDVVTCREKPVAVYILISPLLDIHQRRLARLSLRHFASMLPQSRLKPVLLPLTPWTPQHPASLFVPQTMRDSPALSLARNLQSEIQLQKGSPQQPDPFIDGFKTSTMQVPFYLYGERNKGRVHLPVRHLNQVLRDPSGKWWALLTPLAPRLGAVGLLIGDAPPRRVGVLECAALTWGALCLFVLLIALVETLWCGRALTLGARTTLLAWFFGLAMIPLSLSMESSLKYVGNLSESLHDELRRQLEQTVQTLEAGNNQIDQKTLTACNTFFKKHQTWNPQQFIIQNSDNPDKLRLYVETQGQMPGFQLDGLFVYGGKEYEYAYIDPTIPAASKRLFSSALKNLLKTKLSLERELGRNPTTTEVLANNPWLASLQGQVDSSLFVVGQLNSIGLGEKLILSYYSETVTSTGEKFGWLLLIRQESFMDLQYRLHLEAWETRSPFDLAVFKKNGREYALVAEGGNAQGLDKLADLSGMRRPLATPDALLIRLTSRFIDKYIYVARAATAHIRSRISDELRQTMLAWGFLLSLIGTGGFALSKWLADPIVRMSEGLSEVAAGDFSVRVGLKRGDELGQTAETLDDMIRKLDERRRMSQFVSQSVMETISGDLSRHVNAARRAPYIALVSDIRGFTSLSETYPADRIFQMLNRHLERAARVIAAHRGIVERFIGDAIQAVFPVLDGDAIATAHRARQAALSLMEEHRTLQRERAEAGDFGYSIGIGLDYGTMVNGVVGDPETRLDLSFLGEALPRAAHLESLSRHGRATRIVCSNAFRQLLGPEAACEALAEEPGAWELTDDSRDQPSKSEATNPTSLPSLAAAEAERLSTESAPPETAPVVPTSRLFQLALMLLPALLASFSPLLLLTWQHRQLASEQRASDVAGVRRLLQHDTRLLSQRHLSPDLVAHVIKLELDRVMRSTHSIASDGARLPSALASVLTPLSQRFPDLHWMFLRLKQGSLLYDTYGGDQFHLEVWGPNDPWLPDFTARTIAAGVCHDDLFLQTVFCRHPVWKQAAKTVDPNGDIGQAFGSWVAGGPRGNGLICWFPIITNDWWSSRERTLPINPTGDFHADGVKPLYKFMAGTVLCWWTQNQIASSTALECLIDLVSQQGVQIAIWDPTTPQQTFSSQKTTVHPWVQEAMKSSFQERIIHNHLVHSIDLPAMPGMRALIARPLPMGAPETAAAYFPPLLAVCLILFLILAHTVLARGTRILSLPWQMVCGFLLIFLPSLGFGILSTERSSVARTERLIPQLEQEGQRVIDRYVAGIPLGVAYGAAVMDRTFRSRRLQSRIDALPLPGAERVTAGRRLVNDLVFHLLQRGWAIRNPTLYGLQYDEVFYPIGFKRAVNLSLEDQFCRMMIRRAFASLNPQMTASSGRGSDRQEMLDGAKMEEITTISRAVTPPETVPEASHHPFSSIPGTSKNEFYWMRHLVFDGPPAFMVRADCRMNTVLYNHLNSWFQERSRETEANRLLVCSVTAPHRQFHPPFILLNFDPVDYDFGFTPVLTPTEPELGNSFLLSRLLDAPYQSLIGSGTREVLHLVHPVRDNTRTLVSCSLPSGEERATQAREHRINLILFGAALLLTIFLAVQAARRYTAPLMELSEAAKRIQAEDYRVRLPAGQDDEFGRLALCFNTMARGVEEGRLLSRFVSESVREAAQSRDIEKQAEQGAGDEVVVVFTGLSGFSSLLHSLPPERLIDHLNRYLGRMARLIRSQGGRIDKFIGDKILAVFRPRDFTGRADAVLHAACALQAMRKEMQQLQRTLPCRLGCGLVFGPVLSGILGTGDVRREFTVIGDTVNLASRLCDLGMKQPGGGIVIDLAARDLLVQAEPARQNTLRRMTENSVKGKSRQVEVFMLGDQDA